MSDFPENDVNDLEIKKRARRRLVGATVLALLAVIVLPLAVENSEEPRTVPDMQVSIPERGEFELPQIIPEGGPETARVDIEPDAASSTPVFSTEPPALAQPKPEQPASAPPAAQPSRESGQPPARPGTAERDAEAARALALLNDNAKEAGKGAAQDKVFVQVASFSKADRARKQAEELKKQGFAAYAEKAGKVTRVRIGPLPRSDAEQVVARLDALGQKNAQLLSR